MSTGQRWARRVGRGGFWVILALEVFTMADAGLSKFQNLEGWLYWFAQFGYPPRMSLVVGATEFVAAGLLLVTSLSAYAALVLMVVMAGALEAVLTTETALGWFDPVLHIVFLVIILTVRWRHRWRPLAHARDDEGVS